MIPQTKILYRILKKTDSEGREGFGYFSEVLRQRLTVILFYLGVPGPPLDPVVTEGGPTWATLAWTKPISDGGRPITGYRIQCREVPSKQWRDKATSRICLCDIYGLKPQT